MTSPLPASKLPFLDRHIRPWLESFGCIGGRHEMKRSHAQRSNFKVIGSERISTFRKDCTGSRGARFRPVRGYGCGCQRHLIGSRRPRARDRGRALRRSIPRGQGCCFAAGPTPGAARRAPSRQVATSAPRPWTWCTANGKVTLRFLHGDPSVTYTDGQVSPSVSA